MHALTGRREERVDIMPKWGKEVGNRCTYVFRNRPTVKRGLPEVSSMKHLGL